MLELEGFPLYAAIFVGKTIEVSLDTLRLMLINRGKKLLSSIVGVIYVVIWLLIISSVLTDIADDPVKVVVYSIAYGLGIYLGSVFEQRLAVGLTSLQIVQAEAEAENLAQDLRKSGFGVTILEGHSVGGTKRELIFVQLRRRSVPKAMELIRSHAPNAMVSTSDVRSLRGGFVR